MSNLADAIYEEGVKEGFEKSFEEGFKIGHKNATKEVALNLYKNFNMPIEKIAEIVKFSKDEIQTWINEAD
jgi:flagellar biosynthesis/type III secretory pathway protein FliH